MTNKYENLLMGKNEVEYIFKNLSPNDIMLEWGSGGSTYTFAPKVKTYYSIEHDKNWYNKVNEIIKNNNITNVKLHHVENNTMKFDEYLDKNSKEIFKLYKNHHVKDDIAYVKLRGVSKDWHYLTDYINKIKTFGVTFDKILIDGRARPMCAFLALNYLHDDGLVFLHDFKGRDHYNTVLEYYDIVDEIVGDWPGSLVSLKKK